MKANKTASGAKPVPSPVLFVTTLVLLTLSNFLISFTLLPLSAKLWLLLAGVVAPLAFWFHKLTERKTDAVPFHQKEFLTLFSGVWVLLLGAAILLRLWKIDSLFCWPTGDEALYGAAGLELSQKWDWKFFHTVGQSPPAIVWLCGLFFKIFKDPLLNLWLPAALISILTLGMGFLSARLFFSRSFSLIFACLLAFGYWPLFLGRSCLPGVLVPLGEFCLLYCLGRFLKSGPGLKKRWAFLSGLTAGLQSFTFVAWPVVALAGAAALYFGSRGMGRARVGARALFLAGALLGLLPFLAGVLQQGYGHHIWAVSALGFMPDLQNQFKVLLGFTSVLCWGVYRQDGFCIPPLGGFLNPLLASFFLLGLVEAIRERSQLAKWLFGLGLLFLIPGYLSLNIEGFRIVQVLPLLLFTAAMGLRPLMDHLASTRKSLVLGLLLLLSTAFDWGQLLLPYQEIARYPQNFGAATSKSLARYRAYGLLKELEKKAGPGFVLGEWDLPADRTLEVATYPFNAAMNKGLDPSQVRWLAVLTDAHYRPFLQKRFPQGQYWSLDSDLSNDGTRMLVVLPMDDSTRPALHRWAQADKAFRNLNWGTDHLFDKDLLGTMGKKIQEDHLLVRGDPFLESAFWEKAGEFYYYYGGHFPEHLRAMELSVEKGYPAAHLYAKLAGLWKIAGDENKTRAALEKAKRSEALYPWRDEK